MQKLKIIKRAGENTTHHSNAAYQFIGAMFYTFNLHFVINLSIGGRKKHHEYCNPIYTE